jgi:hypothetical protein
MAATARLAERATAVGLFTAVALNEPLIRLADGAVAGVPGLVLYVFGLWGLGIALVALVMRGGRLSGG